MLFLVGIERKMYGIGSQLLIHHHGQHKSELRIQVNGTDVQGVCIWFVS